MLAPYAPIVASALSANAPRVCGKLAVALTTPKTMKMTKTTGATTGKTTG
jgi:hypothetical protein